jgi:hypothetical protein
MSCSAFRHIEKKDSIGRVVKTATYDGSKMKSFEEIQYVGNTYNPSEITYFKLVDSGLVPYKYEIYSYGGNNINSISVFTEKKKIRTLTSRIKFVYTAAGTVQNVEYHAKSGVSDLYLLGLDSMQYSDREITFRRIIEYQVNETTGKSMQKAQYQITYESQIPVSMKSAVIDSKSENLIENTDDDPEVINNKIESIERYFIQRTLNRDFIRK